MQRRIAIAVALLIVVVTSAGAFAFMHGRALKDVPAPPASPPVPIVAGMVELSRKDRRVVAGIVP